MTVIIHQEIVIVNC